LGGGARSGARLVQQQFDKTEITPRAIIVMGVAGSGKSTLGPLLAEGFGCRFIEGDAFHSENSIAKMRAGEPLSDEDRWPWLDRLGLAMAGEVAAEGLAVAACSALKRRYRERLARAICAPTAFVLLQADEVELARRLTTRQGHYMPASLLTSQLAALEETWPDEPAIVLDARRSPEDLYRAACAWLRSPGSPA
jgi:gluconokinase